MQFGVMWLFIIIKLKGLDMIFAGQKTSFVIFRSKEIYYIFQNI